MEEEFVELQRGAWVVPGDTVAVAGDERKAGPGTYELHGHIHSSQAGVLERVEESAGLWRYEVKGSGSGGGRGPYVGGVITGRVEVMSHRFAKVSILTVDSHVLPHPLPGEIRREEVREREKETVDMGASFRPGDLVVCRVVSAGETSSSFALSTAEEELGVVEARCPEDGTLMKPTSRVALLCPQCSMAAKRKLAHLPQIKKEDL